jgi:8-hydroxy-5-deazaflavin:NADPH oxidoreductase
MFVAGDDVPRKPVVMSLIAKLGFEAIDAGPLRIARLLEAYGMLWIDQALNRGRGRNFAFAITNRSGC